MLSQEGRLVAPAVGCWLRGWCGASSGAGRQQPAGGSAPVAAWTLCDLPHRPTLMISKHHTELPGVLVISKCQCVSGLTWMSESSCSSRRTWLISRLFRYLCILIFFRKVTTNFGRIKPCHLVCCLFNTSQGKTESSKNHHTLLTWVRGLKHKQAGSWNECSPFFKTNKILACFLAILRHCLPFSDPKKAVWFLITLADPPQTFPDFFPGPLP